MPILRWLTLKTEILQLECLQNLRGGEYSGFQVKGMIEWGQKSKPRKIPRACNKTLKNPCRISEP